jgi:hypothetical protein
MASPREIKTKPTTPETIRAFSPGSIFPLILPTTAISKKSIPEIIKRVAKGAANTDLTNASIAFALIRNWPKSRSNTTWKVIFGIHQLSRHPPARLRRSKATYQRLYRVSTFFPQKARSALTRIRPPLLTKSDKRRIRLVRGPSRTTRAPLAPFRFQRINIPSRRVFSGLFVRLRPQSHVK